MRIGIVVPAYNVAPFIAGAMRSVLAQSWRDWRMVVVDDGSTDTTGAVVQSFSDDRVTLLRQANAGVSAARNAGITALLGTGVDALLFLDADDWITPCTLSLLAGALGNNVVAASGACAFVGNGETTLARPPPAGNLLPALLIRNCFANGGQVLVRAGTVRRAGLFDNALRVGEDWEFWVRVAMLGRFATTGTPAPVCFVRERQGKPEQGFLLWRRDRASRRGPRTPSPHRSGAQC